MSGPAIPQPSPASGQSAKGHARQLAKRLLSWHLPVLPTTRPLFAALYVFHISLRSAIGWSLRFLWFEPLFRSQCTRVGDRFRMEQLPYLLGRGEIVIGDRVQFSGKPSIAFSGRFCNHPQLRIGDGCFVGHNCTFAIASDVEVGNHCLISGSVRISDFDGHPTSARLRREGETFDAGTRPLPVRIGNDVWIGHGAVVLKGVSIGDRAVIGARAVVTSDVPADVVVAGVPARIVKHLGPQFPQSARDAS